MTCFQVQLELFKGLLCEEEPGGARSQVAISRKLLLAISWKLLLAISRKLLVAISRKLLGRGGKWIGVAISQGLFAQ